MNGQAIKTIAIAVFLGPLLAVLSFAIVWWILDLIFHFAQYRMSDLKYAYYIYLVYPLLGLQALATGLFFCFIGSRMSWLPFWSGVSAGLATFIASVIFAFVMNGAEWFLSEAARSLLTALLLIRMALGLGTWISVRRFWRTETI